MGPGTRSNFQEPVPVPVVPGPEILEPVSVSVPFRPFPKFLVSVPKPVGTSSKIEYPVDFQLVFASCEL